MSLNMFQAPNKEPIAGNTMFIIEVEIHHNEVGVSKAVQLGLAKPSVNR